MPPVHLMLKPASAGCNLRCKYCFYADEAACRAEGMRGMMTRETAALAAEKALAHAEGLCTFAFQGGEPTLAGLSFFKDFVAAAERANRRGVRIDYAFQTNGIALDEEWAAFFAEHHFLVGVSIDGCAAVHDALRPFPDGSPSHARVMRNLRMLRDAGVECNVLTVVTKQLARSVRETYECFRDEGLLYQQYIPCMDPLGEARGGHGYSLSAKDYAKFLHRLFCLWKADLDAGRYVSVRHFDNWMSILLGRPPESCNMRGTCGVQYVAEADGSVYPCDFYCLDEWKLGDVHTDDFAAMDARRAQLKFIERSLPVPDECRRCPWYALCRNGCPRDRVPQPGGAPPKNCYCDAHREFFSLHARELRDAARLIVSRGR